MQVITKREIVEARKLGTSVRIRDTCPRHPVGAKPVFTRQKYFAFKSTILTEVIYDVLERLSFKPSETIALFL